MKRGREGRVSSAPSRLSAAVAVAGLLTWAGAASGGSSLRLEPFESDGVRNGTVYDAAGVATGSALVRFETLAERSYHLRVETHIDDGVSSELEAFLGSRPDGSLALRSEHSQTFDVGGQLTVGARIDHVRGRGVCTHGDGSEEEIVLPRDERIANVALPLLLLPLARGEREQASYQFLLCRTTPRILDATASVARRFPRRGGGTVVEIASEFDLGPVLSVFAAPFIPHSRFWLDPGDDPEWLGHHLPLYPGGPELSVLREGAPIELLLRGASR